MVSCVGSGDGVCFIFETLYITISPMPKQMKSKKSAGRSAAFTVAEKRFLVNNVDLVKPVSEEGWEKVHGMHISMYGHKNRTAESLRRCFTTLHRMKCPSGDPGMPVEVHNAKMACLHIRAKSKCATGSSDDESEKEGSDNDEEEDDNSQELLGGAAMEQTIPSMMTAKKGVIKLDSNSGSDSDISAFEKPFKKAKNVSELPKRKSSSFSVPSSINTVERKHKKPAEIKNNMFFIMQQQVKQRKDNKAAREQHIILSQMEREAKERACKEREVQLKGRHQDFMTMMMVTGVKSPSTVASLSSSFESPSKPNASPMHSTPTSTTTMISAVLDDSHFQDGKKKKNCNFDAMEKQIAEEKERHNFDAMERKLLRRQCFMTLWKQCILLLPPVQQHPKQKGRRLTKFVALRTI
eukprot:15365392-Ditylum_brightwellii.AAC.1